MISQEYYENRLATALIQMQAECEAELAEAKASFATIEMRKWESAEDMQDEKDYELRRAEKLKTVLEYLKMRIADLVES